MKKQTTLISLLILISVIGCKAQKPIKAQAAPAKIEKRKDGQPSSVILSEAAEQRLGIVTVRTKDSDAVTLPSSAVLYDVDGSVWVYVRTAKQSYQRTPIALKRVEGRSAKLNTALPADIEIVTEGAAELFGTETGGGK